MDYEPTPVETARILALLGRGGAALQKELKPALDKREREALKAAGFLTVERGPRGALRVELTDRAWDWAERHLQAPSSLTGAAATVLRDWLAALHRFMVVRDVRLFEVLKARPVAPQADLDDRPAPLAFEAVREAALALGGGRAHVRVRLTDLRQALPHAGREALDAVLRQAAADGRIALYPLDDARDRTAADEAAAVSLGGMPAHLLYLKQDTH